MSQNKFFKNFLPFGLLVIGSYIGMVQFRQINYKYKKNNNLDVYQEQLTKAGMSEDSYQSKTTVSLKDEYEKVMNKIDLDHWNNIRGPRPWENSKEIQEQMRNENKENKTK
jgi:cytochrome c oxidase assembly protein subunit 16